MASGKGPATGLQLAPTDVNASSELPSSTKKILIQRINNGFGFTLRHFVVYPPEVIRPSSQENPLHGVENDQVRRGKPMDTVFVRQVAPNGPADKAGLSSGDQIVSVNGNQVLNRTYSQVIELIQKSVEQVELGVIPKEDCVLEMVSPKKTITPAQVKPSPPPTKPKPARSGSVDHGTPSPGKVTSTVIIAPTPSPDAQWKNTSVTLKLTDTSVDSHVTPTSETHVSRRGSIDRSAQEHRNFVISDNSNEDTNNNKKHSPSPGQHGSMDGTFFYAATDYTGKAKALHFQRGATSGDNLTVIDDPKSKGRSRSLPAVEMKGFQGWQESRRRKYEAALQNGLKTDQNTLQIHIGGNHNKSDNSISNFSISSPRTVALDSSSTMNVSPNSDSSSRQPVASDPNHRRMSGEESTSYLIRTIASHMNQERNTNLKSSTMEATLLESQPTRRNSDHAIRTYDQLPLSRQSGSSEHLSYSNQVSIYPNQTHLENSSYSESHHMRLETPTVQGRKSEQSSSPRQRRTSYLMATGSAPTSPTSKLPPRGGSTKKVKPTLSSALSSSFITPMMVHVSTGNNGGQEERGEDFLENDEIFMEGEHDDDSLAPRLGRRVSYVMATSTPSSPTTLTLEGMKEEEDEHTIGNMEISKEGLLWKKLAVAGGGKRSSVRSWKPVYTVLKGHVMYFHKDKESAHHGDGFEESQPISIKSSIVDIAYDYTKRKNVFRMTTYNGSEFLFQAEDHESMMTWIAAIQANNNPDEDKSGVTSQSLIIRRMRTVEQETGPSNNQTPTSQKLTPAGGAKMPNFSNLKKSLSFKNISGSQKGDGTKNHQWHKGHKKRKKPPSAAGSNYTPGHTIGVPLEMCPCSKSNKFVPILVEHCCDVVGTKGIEAVGVYRVPGNSAAVGALSEELNEKGAENINFQEEKWHDVNNITSLLKQFLRKLPEGLVTAELYESFIEANRKDDPVERMGALKMLINELPDHNYETLRHLLTHLKHVAEHADTNKMEARNLAIVFGPTLVRTGEDTMMSMVKDMSDQCRIVETILTHNEWFFEGSEGEDAPPSKPPLDATDNSADQFVSLSVLSSLGQAAGSFNEEGNIKHKPTSPGHLTLHIPKFRTKPGKSESQDSHGGDSSPSDGSMSPTSSRPVLRFAGSCPGSPTQERASNKLMAKRHELSSSSTGSMSSAALDVNDSESRTRGCSSLRAYSYARPPPPSYRKSGPPKRPNSPSNEQDGPQGNATSGFMSETSDGSKKDDGHDEHGLQKPTFASLSEETRLRLLKVSLQQKAAEKKRMLESPTSPHPPTFPDVNGELTVPHREHETSDSTEHLSSDNTSRSSSTPSSKNASRESLQHQQQMDEAQRAVPFKTESVATSSPATSQESTTTSSQTVLTILHGEGVPAAPAEATRRPASSDIRARRNTAEGLRIRRSLQSESSDSSGDEEGELKLSMSKTFDEKLRILLDLDYQFKDQKRKEEETAAVAGARRPSDELTDDAKGSNTSLNSSASERKPSVERPDAQPRRASVERSLFINKPPATKSSLQINTKSKQVLSAQPKAASKRPVSARDPPKAQLSMTKPEVSRKSEGSFLDERQASKIGHVHTATPVALREFKIDGNLRKEPKKAAVGSTPPSRAPAAKPPLTRHDSPFVKSMTESGHGKSRTETSSITISPRHPTNSPRGYVSEAASPRNSSTETSPRNSRTEMNINLSGGQLKTSSEAHSRKMPGGQPKYGVPGNRRPAASKYAAMAARTHVPPKVMGRDTTAKSPTYPHRDAHRDILPSRSTYGGSYKEPVRQKHVHKMESNAKHIAELLEEMHSERYLKMSRQRSDISGQAQKAAAQRAAQARMRRRSLGDENQENIALAVAAADKEKLAPPPPQGSQRDRRQADDTPLSSEHRVNVKSKR
ncbi:rho GTPase-activating protein 21-B [Nematostella vectensis]|uniref:rho GTPase-activating protein 21-B n=1 Tax=Nematostella vectensis TaxID=45351 RepID=UPI002076E218|nr:rho GTPase-activating protein 21-B [Nematostella vectensis]